MALSPTTETPLVPADIKRSVFAIHIVPLGKPLTITGRKLHITLARLAGQQYQLLSFEDRSVIENALRDYVAGLRLGKKFDKPPILLQPQFQASLKELAKGIGFEESNARHLMAHLNELVTTPVQFNTLRHRASSMEQDVYTDEMEVRTALLSSVVKVGKDTVAWSYDPKILGIMVEPRTFTMLNAMLVRNSRTYTALALYENCRRFVGIGRAGPYPFEKWQELLSPNSQRPDWETTPELLRRIKRTIKELEACDGCDIEITPKRVRVANLGSCLEFEVKERKQPQLPFGLPVPKNVGLFGTLKAMGYSGAKSNALVDEYGEEYIISKLSMMERARAKKPIENPRAWLTAAIERDFQDAEELEKEAKKKAKEQQSKSQLQTVLKEAFLCFKQSRLRRWFAEAPAELQHQWRSVYVDSKPNGDISGYPANVREQFFFGWLATQEHQLNREPEETNEVLFVITYSDIIKEHLNSGTPLPDELN